MAYNNGFPATYQQMYPQQFQQAYPQQMYMPQPMAQQPAPQVQQQAVPSGFVRVRNENEARMYPVAPGSSVTFIDENGPYCYSKTVNMGQLDRPIFEKYRLVKEDEAPAAPESLVRPLDHPQVDLSAFALKTDVAAFKSELEAFRADIEAFRGDLYGLAGKKKATTKKEVTTDE